MTERRRRRVKEESVETEVKNNDSGSEQLQAELEAALKSVAMLKTNQEALIKENDSLRDLAENAHSGKLIYKKLIDIKNDLTAVTKDQYNTHQKFKFRGIDQFINHLKPVLDKHRVGMRTKVLQNAEEFKVNAKDIIVKNTRIIMEYTFFAEDGSEVSCSIPAEGVDTSDKGTNKALSAALKYCLIQTFCIPTEDMEEGDFTDVKNGKAAKLENPTENKATPTKERVEKSSRRKTFRRKSKSSTVTEGSADVEL